MAEIKLDLQNYLDEVEWTLDATILNDLLDGLLVTIWGEVVNEHGGSHTLTFVGEYDELVKLVRRYEQDSALADELIEEIK